MTQKSPFSISQELELLSSLEANGAVPLKFAYLGDGYLKWISIAEMSRETGGVEKVESELLKENLPFIFEDLKKNKFKELSIVDLGCGDGGPIKAVFDFLKEKGFFETYDITYIPIDISQNMLDHATKEITSLFNVKAKPTLIDFEKGSFPETLISSSDKKSYNFCFFLGNTLGNFSDTGRILSNFKESLFSTDHLIIGNELANLMAVHKMLDYYKGSECYGLDITTLRYYGYKDEYGTYNVRWNENKKQIESYLVLNQDVEFTIANSKIAFEKGEEILLSISKKFVEEDLIKIINDIGFRIHLFTTNKQKRHCILSLNPSRYRTN